MMRMARASERFGADQLLFAQVDLRLIPEFDPAFRQRFVEIDAAGDRGRLPEIELLQQFQDGIAVSNGLRSAGSICRRCCSPMLLTCASTAEPRLLINCTRPR